MKNIKTTLGAFILESTTAAPIIEFTEQDIDERAERKKKVHTYDVSYHTTVDGILVEITGTLSPFESGRATEYEFQTSHFNGSTEEKYYDDNWEKIESDILDAFGNR
jgi:hypothetical protein